MKSLWNRLGLRKSQRGLIWSVELNLPGWIEVPAKEEMRLWNDSEGDTLSLMKVTAANTLPDFRDEAELRQECRRIAEYQNGGLIEVSRAEEGRIGPSVSLIYKLMPQPPKLIYSGQIVTSWLIWTIVAHERGTTGVRPSIVFAHLVQTGKLDPRDFERLWGAGPV